MVVAAAPTGRGMQRLGFAVGPGGCLSLQVDAQFFGILAEGDSQIVALQIIGTAGDGKFGFQPVLFPDAIPVSIFPTCRLQDLTRFFRLIVFKRR